MVSVLEESGFHGLQVDLQTCPRKREPNSESR